MPQSLYLLSYLILFFLQFKSRKEDRERERKGSIPFHHTGKKRQRRMGVPFLLHEDHLDVSPTRSTFSFGSFSGIGEDRRGIERGGWQTTILGEMLLSLPQVLSFLSWTFREHQRLAFSSSILLLSFVCCYILVRRSGNSADSRPGRTSILVHFPSENYHLYRNNSYCSNL